MKKSCASCEKEVEVAIMIDRKYYCEDCVVTCFHCNATVPVDNTHSDDCVTICDSCFGNYYFTCNNCDSIIRSQETMFDSIGDSYCEDCAPNSIIRSWDYRPAPTFFGNDSKLYMGVELEVDRPKYYCNKIKAIKEIDDIMGNHVYFKEDGSLEEGFEIVSNPMTLNYHMNKCPWKDMLETVVDIGFRSHDAYTCGLHVHVSRAGLGETTEEQEETILKILFFVERFWTPLVTFSRRKGGQLARWAKRYGLKSDVQDVPKDLLDRAKCCNKYYAVNLNPYHTIEFRLFRGTLNYTTFMATLQFVHTVVEFVKATTIEELMDLTWQDFIKKIKGKYEELDGYLAKRGLIGEFKPIQESFVEAIDERSNDDDYSDEDCEDEESYDLDFDFSSGLDYFDSIIGGY